MTDAERDPRALTATEVAETARRLDLLGCTHLAAAVRSPAGRADGGAALHRLARDLLDVDVHTLARPAAVWWLEVIADTGEPREECAADIPAAAPTTVNRSHLPTCSLYPDNATPARRWNDHSNDLGDWCPWSRVSVSARLDDEQPCPAACRSAHIVEEG
jgi:hypothetical protein